MRAGRIDRPSPLGLIQRKLYAVGDYSPEMRAYVAAHDLDLDTIVAHAGVLAVALAQISGQRDGVLLFDFDPEGVPAAVCEVLAADGATVVDLVAWPLDAPDRFAVAVGEADMLGNNAATNPATFWRDKPLRVHRTPLAWLKAGCDGCCPLSPAWAGHWLDLAVAMAPPGAAILADDVAHGREIKRMLRYGFDPTRLHVPAAAEERRAA